MILLLMGKSIIQVIFCYFDSHAKIPSDLTKVGLGLLLSRESSLLYFCYY